MPTLTAIAMIGLVVMIVYSIIMTLKVFFPKTLKRWADYFATPINEKPRMFGIFTVDQKRLERLINYGFKTVHIFKNYYLIRNYSILCKRKRFSLYRLLKLK